jgi:hypothetical protein
LRHASARNVIEHIFGVLKRRFRILLLPPEYKLSLQARIPTALSAVHNFIRKHDPTEAPLPKSNDAGRNTASYHPYLPEAATGQDEPSERRDRIADAMWRDYQLILASRRNDSEGDDDTEDFSSGDDLD